MLCLQPPAICRQQGALLHSIRTLGAAGHGLLQICQSVRIAHGDPIDVYNYGKMKRDFTYIDDVIEGGAGIILALRIQMGVPQPPGFTILATIVQSR